MNKYIQTTGAIHTGSFMQAPALKPGYIWLNVSKLGEANQEFIESVDFTGPSPKTLFGYPEKEFLAKQYR